MYGQIPSARRAHAAVYYKDRILVFGGGNGTRALNDCFACNVKNPEAVEWTQLETTGTRPISRGYHTLTRVGSKAVVFGGSVRRAVQPPSVVLRHMRRMAASVLVTFMCLTWVRWAASSDLTM